MTLENKHGDTALDVAKNWGDDFIYAIVYAKLASLPPVENKKGTTYVYVHAHIETHVHTAYVLVQICYYTQFHSSGFLIVDDGTLTFILVFADSSCVQLYL